LEGYFHEKIFLVTLAFIILIVSHFPQNIYALENDSEIYEIELNVNNSSILFHIPTEFSEEFTENQLMEIASHHDLEDGDVITILEIGNPIIEEETVSPRLIFRYDQSVSRIPGTSEFQAQSFFITSVARGMTIRLTRAFSQTLSMGFNAGTGGGANMPFNITGSLNHSVTASVTTQVDLVGPPENGPHNTREFRVRFFGENVNWTQTRTNSLTGNSEQRSGTGTRPTRYMRYSIDRFN